jgi:hypothetical protein
MNISQRDKRTRRARAIFSPSENYTRPTHYLLYFESTDSYNTALASSIHNINENIATLNIRGKKSVATIITAGYIRSRLVICFRSTVVPVLGTLKMCEDEQHKRTRESQEIQDDGNDKYSCSTLNNESTYLFSRQRFCE